MSRDLPRLNWEIAARLHYLDASRNDRSVLASQTLMGLVARDVRPLVEVRCRERGHFLAAVHSTRYGPLFWTFTSRKRLSPALVRAAAEAVPESWGETPMGALSLRVCDFEPGVRDHGWVKDLGWFPAFCRCGQRAIVIDEVFEAARTATTQNRKITLNAQVVNRSSTA